jgi:hypothetical protein
VRERPRPPHDCRLTVRCLRETFGFSLRPGESFETLRSENTLIDRFFERRQNDPEGGEGGERIVQVRARPVFKLTSGRMRAATWFDVEHPPQGIVWLLGAELHDERHKGAHDAYDRFAGLEASGELFPVEIDYKWLELDRRRLDTSSLAADARTSARVLVEKARAQGRASGELAGVPAWAAWESAKHGLVALYVAVSTRPVRGVRSGYDIPLTNERFLLLAEAVRQAAEEVERPEALVDELARVPAILQADRGARAFVVVFETG